MSNLSLKNLSKVFDAKTVVLRGINLEITQGEFVVLVGPSGCGKSTLLRLIAGLEQPTEGEIFIDGVSVAHKPPVERDIAMVFQDYALYPHMTVAENMTFGLKIRKVPKAVIAEKLKTASKILGIESLLDRKPSQLSGGQRQRVAIGRAIVREPKLFLFDEPLSNLDAKLRADMRIDLSALHQRVGQTSIYVTHDQQEAMTLADRIVVLDKGEIQQVGTPIEVYNKPANVGVATFIGSPTMNLFTGELLFEGNKKTFRFGDNALEMGDGFDTPLKPGSYKLGIRAEDLTLGIPENEKNETSIRAKLLVKEVHGHEIQVVAEVGGARIISRVSERDLMSRITGMHKGSEIYLPVHGGNLHWFENTQHGARI